MPKAMKDDFERGEQGPGAYIRKVEKKFGRTTMTNLKVKGPAERTAKRVKIDDMVHQKG